MELSHERYKFCMFLRNCRTENFCASLGKLRNIWEQMLLTASNSSRKIHLIESEVTQNKELNIQLCKMTKN